MRINPNEKIQDVPMIQIRKLLRKKQDYLTVVNTAKFLDLTQAEAAQLLDTLTHEGYIELMEEERRRPYWKATVLGGALALASAAKPVKRSTADRVLAEFMERVEEVNRDPYYLCKVTRVVLFGSYLGDAERINDLDLAVDLAFKEDDPEKRMKLSDARIREAEKAGRRFGNLVERYGWPYQEVLLKLKSRSRTLSLHTTSDPILEQVESKVIFSEEQGWTIDVDD